MHDIAGHGDNSTFLAIEIGSPGYVSEDNKVPVP